ncbi:hypothetical protein [Variovorax saccharolyticus]|uniref:hypothetical protein n=1 Tax=Variovorax saccharolyticus TaxID=3053516 RepID=UPI0025763A52|nr:hypothetical protein [Variovorax sp. J31P216]MDM0024059.1 hypothetical protein [Variovorax sp. J31P216]
MTKATLRRQDLAEMAALMKEAAAAVHLLPESVSARHRVRQTLVPDLMAMAVRARDVVEGSAGVSVEQAKQILGQESKGILERTSPAQGGRAWLEGEWGLDELEALCVILRQEAGDQARGAAEFVVVWKDEE